MKKQNSYLILRSKQEENLYGTFLQEILKSEGLMCFDSTDIDTQKWPDLQPEDLVLVSRCFFTKSEIKYLLDIVEKGLNITFIQPQPFLVEQLGGKQECRVIYPGYVSILEGFPGMGETIQTHLPIACYNEPTNGSPWEVIAKAVDSNRMDSGFPSVVRLKYGRGNIALFFYDLPEAVARIRFGNPDLASYATLGCRWPWPHAGDLFEGHLDQCCVALPQADLHGQLLAKVLTDMSTVPLGRFWYYEDSKQRSAAVLQSDQDGAPLEYMEKMAAIVEKYKGNVTFYLLGNIEEIPREWVESMCSRGCTFGPHVSPLQRYEEELYFNIPAALSEETEDFKARFGECSKTLQCHCAPWMGYMSQLPVHERNGYRLLFAYMSVPKRNWAQYMCGSGRPMKFYDRAGTLFDCWQQPLVIMDDATLIEKLEQETDASLEEFEVKLQAALNVNHTAFAMLSHPSYFLGSSNRFMEGCLSRFAEEGIPVYNADRWCEFIDRRSAVRLRQTIENGGHFIYTVSGLEGKLPLMVPMKDGAEQKNYRVEIDGVSIPCLSSICMEEKYLFIPLVGKKTGETLQIDVYSNI